MTVVAAYLYRHGKRVREVAIDEKVDCPADRSEFVWIGIADPTVDEMRILQEHYGLHPLAIEDAMKADQLPKVDLYSGQLFVVARTAHLEAETIAYGETAIFVGHSHIISVRHGSARAHKALRDQLEATPACSSTVSTMSSLRSSISSSTAICRWSSRSRTKCWRWSNARWIISSGVPRSRGFSPCGVN